MAATYGCLFCYFIAGMERDGGEEDADECYGRSGLTREDAPINALAIPLPP